MALAMAVRDFPITSSSIAESCWSLRLSWRTGHLRAFRGIKSVSGMTVSFLVRVLDARRGAVAFFEDAQVLFDLFGRAVKSKRRRLRRRRAQQRRRQPRQGQAGSKLKFAADCASAARLAIE